MASSTDSSYRAAYHAAVLVEPKRIELREVAPLPLGAAHALVRVHAAGICGTDLAIHDGHYPVPLPLVLGHEWVGTVEAVGDEKDKGLVGKRVVGEINNHCQANRVEPLCAACAKGLPNHCRSRTVTGIMEHPGAFAERLVCPTDNLHVLPDDLEDESAVFIEPLAAALQTFALAPLPDDALVAVLGCGRLGALIAMVLIRLGAKTLAFTDRQDDVENARAIGVEAQNVMANEQIVDAVKDATGGLGADIVVEATGSPGGLSVALDCVRPRGTIALKSTPGTPVEKFDLTRVVVDEIRLQGSRCGDFAKAIAFWQEHRPPLSRLIRSQFPLDRLDEAIAKAHGPGKVFVRCGS